MICHTLRAGINHLQKNKGKIEPSSASACLFLITSEITTRTFVRKKLFRDVNVKVLIVLQETKLRFSNPQTIGGNIESFKN